MKTCPDCKGALPEAMPGVCVDIDGYYWHEPGSCQYCTSLCSTCRGGGTVPDEDKTNDLS